MSFSSNSPVHKDKKNNCFSSVSTLLLIGIRFTMLTINEEAVIVIRQSTVHRVYTFFDLKQRSNKLLIIKLKTLGALGALSSINLHDDSPWIIKAIANNSCSKQCFWNFFVYYFLNNIIPTVVKTKIKIKFLPFISA